MALVKQFESSHVAIGGFLRQLIICSLRCLGIGCGHVRVHSGKLGRYLTTSSLFGTNLTRPRVSREQHCPLEARVGMRFGGPVPSNAAVMRCFTRVVALPDSKIVIFPAESIVFVRLGCRIGDTRRADKRAAVKTAHHDPS